MKNKVTVTRPYLPARKHLDVLIDRIFESGWVTNNGELVQSLESRLEAYLGVENVVLVANGTLALQVAYQLFELDGEMVTTPFSFVATPSSIKWHGAKPVFADVETSTLNLDPSTVSEKVTERTSAIVPVHVYGNPCQHGAIESIAKEHQLRLIYDASHAFGIKDHEGESILNWGEVSTLSFHATKLFHTIEGGALVIKDNELASRARRMINFGFSDGEIQHIGINAKMNEFEAAVGHCLLDEIDDLITERKSISEQYDDALKNISRPEWRCGFSKNYSYYPIILESEEQVTSILSKLEEIDVVARRYFFPSLDTLDFLNPVSSSISQDLASRVLCLPIYNGLKPEQIGDIAKQVNSRT